MRVSLDAQQAKGSAFTNAVVTPGTAQIAGTTTGDADTKAIMAIYNTSGGCYTPQLPGAGSSIMHLLDREPRSGRF